MTVKKMAMIAIFTGVASIINILESYVQLVPGTAFKIGFSNIVTLIILYVYGPKEAVMVVLLRLVVTALFAPGTFNGVTFTLSISGAIFSLLTLIILKKVNILGILAVSSVSSVMHVIGQIVAAMYIIAETALFYAPIMLFLSVPAGILTGLLAKRFLDGTKDLFIEKKF
ncbi:Gx transporter family protein [Acholeplasma vituli]|uniref:Gx transporter family protein n=1 Tax=Paracholeplasma vituli TaxID=69473 RepID=A0ABT2PTA5_9MOLU|nr:Gx transporter family protein [Paracholeplasma vituli]MCU0104060.1 Gx transporter family protein [Paracholeplasma vituli]